MVEDNATSSLLDYKQSSVIKGFLITLIVLGHNKYLMIEMNCFLFLYSFHVYDFYLLPFLYDFRKKRIGKLILTNLKRFYVPYFFTFVLLLIVVFFLGNLPSLENILLTFLCGSQGMFSEHIGIGNFLWFIPTIFSLLFIREIYYRLNKSGRILVLSLSLIFLFIFAYVGVGFFLFQYAPCCFFLSLSMIFPAIFVRTVISYINFKDINLLFFIFVICILIIYGTDSWYVYNTLNRIISPSLMLLFIVSMIPIITKIQLFDLLGHASFKIYIIHIFLYNLAYNAIDSKFGGSLFLGLILFVFVLASSYYISKVKILNLFFPR